MSANPSPSAPRQKRGDSFTTIRAIGSGAFGQVLEVEDKETHRHYAMKVLSKTQMIREKKMKYVKVERDVMLALDHPNIVRLFVTFQDPSNLYYVVELAHKGDLQKFLNDIYALDIAIARPLLGQVLLALAHMHKARILHRDLKPDNILIDDRNRVKITDFGTSKIFGKDGAFSCQRGSFVGSADYVSPEVLSEAETGPWSDLWSYGCLVYAVIVGHPPFQSESQYATFELIESGKFEIPEFVPEHARDLITRILVSDPAGRLGYGGQDSNYEPIRSHPFFAGINWDTLPKQALPNFVSYEPAIRARDEKLEREQSAVGRPSDAVTLREGLVTYVKGAERKEMWLVMVDTPRLFLTDRARLRIEISLAASVTVTRSAPNILRFEENGEIFEVIADEAEAGPWLETIEAAIRTICE
jgi:3-phosphoinositide dependent protein kinase-1